MLKLVLLFFFIYTASVVADPRTEMLSDVQNQRTRELYRVVKCPVCAGQSLGDSDAEIARDLQAIIKHKIYNNVPDMQIKQDLVAIYGQDILFEPPDNAQTFLLNYGIWIILIGFFLFFLYNHSQKSSAARGQSANPDID